MHADRLPALARGVEQRGGGLDQRRLERVEHRLDVGELEVARVRIAADEARRSPAHRLASSQLGPTPMSTTSGTCSSTTCSMCSRTSARIGLELVRRHLEDQLVVHLQQHPALELPLGDGGVDPDHGELDQVGRGALERRVLRVALAVGAHVEVAVLDLGDVAAALEQGLDVALLPRQLDHAVEERRAPRRSARSSAR